MPRMLRPLAALAGVSTAAAGACWDRYQSVFHQTIAGVEYSWDLSTLCQPNGEYYVQVNDPAAGQYIAFNVAGNTSSMCSFDPATPLYDSRGSAIQFVEGWNNGNPGISPATLAGKACPKQNNCTDWDNAPAMTDGAQGCCSNTCEVVGTDYVQFSVVNPNNPIGANSAIQLRFASLGSLADDAWGCPYDPGRQNKLVFERNFVVILTCDKNAPTNSIVNLAASEGPTCTYVVTGRSAAACGSQGDPYSQSTIYKNSDGWNFFYTCLGAFLAIFVPIAYRFADSRGWLDPITRHIPPVSNIPVIGSIASAMGYSGGYSKSVSMTTAAGSGGSSGGFGSSAATPITAGAYGSA